MKMKKTKLILASLCASVLLFSTAPSSALVSGEKEYHSYEAKAGRIVDFMKNSDKHYLLSFHQTVYGQYPVIVDYDKETDDIIVFIWDKGKMPLVEDPGFMMADWKSNKYGRLDEISKKNKEGNDYIEVDGKTLTDMQIHNLRRIYHGIIVKFYNENEDKMATLEDLPKQNKEMKELFKILKEK